jgi:hypothetical protein
VEFLFQPIEAFGGLGDRAVIFVEDDVLSGDGPDHFRAPRRWAGPWVARPVSVWMASSHARLRAWMASSAIDGTETGGQVSGAHQAAELDRILTIGVHPVAGLFGNQGGRDDPADLACFVRWRES